MIDSKLLDDFVRRISETVPKGAQDLREDIEKNARAVLSSAFARLDLVPREEFEVQQGVLARTRSKIEALEERVAALEAALAAERGAGGQT